MLAVRISFMNELANLADATGACIDSVREAMALDERVGRKFLNSGCGYGGSCFPKDVTSLVKQGEAAGTPMRIADAASEINIRQRTAMADRIISLFQSRGEAVTGRMVALWGMAFAARHGRRSRSASSGDGRTTSSGGFCCTCV